MGGPSAGGAPLDDTPDAEASVLAGGAPLYTSDRGWRTEGGGAIQLGATGSVPEGNRTYPASWPTAWRPWPWRKELGP